MDRLLGPAVLHPLDQVADPVGDALVAGDAVHPRQGDVELVLVRLDPTPGTVLRNGLRDPPTHTGVHGVAQPELQPTTEERLQTRTDL